MFCNQPHVCQPPQIEGFIIAAGYILRIRVRPITGRVVAIVGRRNFITSRVSSMAGALLRVSECFLAVLNGMQTKNASQRAAFQLLGMRATSLPFAAKSYICPHLDRTTVSDILSDISAGMRTSGQTRLLLAGGDFEAHITVVALLALAEGFDTFLLYDLLHGADPLYMRAYQLRLLQAGAVPTTFRQLLMEWQADESDKEVGSSIAALWDEFLNTQRSFARF